MSDRVLVKTVFNTAPLITCCRFQFRAIPIVDYILAECRITIPLAVSEELIAEKDRYPDALTAWERIKEDRIEVREVKLPSKSVLDFYTLGTGEKAAIVLSREIEDEIDFLVIDDQLGYIVCDRLEIRKLFLLDLVLKLVEGKRLAPELARQIINVVRPRYSEGLIKHTLVILERGGRKCLW
jgi:predicted nucleic acid-binding protein